MHIVDTDVVAVEELGDFDGRRCVGQAFHAHKDAASIGATRTTIPSCVAARISCTTECSGLTALSLVPVERFGLLVRLLKLTLLLFVELLILCSVSL